MYKWLDEWKRPKTFAKIVFFIGMIGIIAIPAWLQKTRHHPLNWYQKAWCEEQGGKADANMPDRTACGCLTDTHAVEFAFADTWHEAVGQALYNGMQTNKKAAIVLIKESETDDKYLLRLRDTIAHFRLPVEVRILEDGVSGQ